MRYKQIIFDVDDTLIDFPKTEDYSLNKLFNSHGLTLTKDLKKKYHTWNQGMWRKLEKGEITPQQLNRDTFRIFFKDNFGMKVDGEEVTNEYREYFSQCHELLPGVKDTLIYAKRMGYELSVLSNGDTKIQEKRLSDAGILNYFDLIVTSEDAGVSKPDKRIFDYFFDHSDASAKDTLFFGDGLMSDILGAERYGFDSIWYNVRHRKDTIGLHPLFEVDTYEEFVKLMQKDFQK
ncbi:MAG: YjjG family noncanonical pyrimidine nucleotidase [Lactobacillus sp.]|nr:YjjG family noncanonical pyrimidine nucleotidase [Lactobacillus sp.]